MAALYTYMERLREVSQLQECKKPSFPYKLAYFVQAAKLDETGKRGRYLIPFSALEIKQTCGRSPALHKQQKAEHRGL